MILSSVDRPKHESINYIEFPANNFAATKTFFKAVFAWEFQDYGEEYTAFSRAGLDGGFYKSTTASKTENGAALLVIYSENLEETLAKVSANGAVITKGIFAFPGGRRFEFCEPSGNELAVWSDIF